MTEKWAIVTGASAGIGLDIAKLLAERDYHLVLVARSKDKLEEAQRQLASGSRQVRIVAIDLAKAGASESLVHQTDKWGIVPEVLVNNAGSGVYGPFLDSNIDDVQGMLNLNIDALVHLTWLYGRKMRERKNGYIMQVASTGAFQPLPNYAAYAASKSFVLNFSRAFNYESRADGVTSTALCPGPTLTGFFDKAQHKLSRSFQTIMMSSQDVARHGVNAMFAREECQVAGLLNKVSANLPRLLPSRLVVRGIAMFMK
ncbi:MAG TPA: SDR family oxidoreductase [Oligoflexus sp.]|uniref:SDR family NAD(P)-dependent oxidoreductase n=1 Tax=Oligoflexus sp. TaxID=1971216 RepID=UPI002D30F0A0|nr:SDR family oxidoreductase [Oligoflexus sp.]HYX37192.1 SDR family oxidoreductase [Oligoflexus sp.]